MLTIVTSTGINLYSNRAYKSDYYIYDAKLCRKLTLLMYYIFYYQLIGMQERIICVHGNIGAGKTTLIESEKYNDFIRMKEPVDDWADYLPKYYKAL